MNDNCCTPGGLPAPAAPGLNPEAFDPCKSAIPVVICDGAPAGPVTLTGADCAGAPVDAAAPKGQIAYAVQPAGQVYKVQLCAPGAQDRELVVLCKANGDKVTLQYDVLTTPPTLVSQFNLNTNAADTTPLTALTDCGIEKLDYGSAVPYCLDGVSYTRIDVFDAQSQFVIGSVWQDEAGVQVVAPSGATIGQCVLNPPCKVPCQTSAVEFTELLINIKDF